MSEFLSGKAVRIQTQVIKARKRHFCGFCIGAIEKGDDYIRVNERYDLSGVDTNWASHIMCYGERSPELHRLRRAIEEIEFRIIGCIDDFNYNGDDERRHMLREILDLLREKAAR